VEHDVIPGLEEISAPENRSRIVFVVETAADFAAVRQAAALCTWFPSGCTPDDAAPFLGRRMVLLPREEGWASGIWPVLLNVTETLRIFRLPGATPAEWVAEHGRDGLAELHKALPAGHPDTLPRPAAIVPPAAAQAAGNVTDIATKQSKDAAERAAKKAARDKDRAERLQARRQLGFFPFEGRPWSKDLILSMSSGLPKPILANAITVLRQDAGWHGCLVWDRFADTLRVRRTTPAGNAEGVTWSDSEARKVCEHLQRLGIHVNVRIADEAVAVVAHENPVHPLLDYLKPLVWDGVPRIADWPIRLAGVEDTRINRTMASRWMIGCVQRAMFPGCVNRVVLVLEGPQDAGKSTAFRILGGDWYTDDVQVMGGKETAMQLQGTWIVELAELVALWRSDQEGARAWISRCADHYRRPYEAHPIKSPRSAALGATVNPGENGYLRDSTGATRFWPLTVTRVDLEALRGERDQLWAEAVHRFRAGEAGYLDTEELRSEAAEVTELRRETDEWEAKIEHWLEHQPNRYPGKVLTWSLRPEPLNCVSVADVLEDCLDKKVGDWARKDELRIGAALRALGFARRQIRVTGTGKKPWRWVTRSHPNW
jgi:predicted P-loop ATPase